MNKNGRILIVVDPKTVGEQASVERGRWLAQKLSLDVELLICYYDQSLTGANFFGTVGLQNVREAIVHQNREQLDEIAAPFNEDGIDVAVSSIWDTPLDEGIIRHALRTEPAFVVKETYRHVELSGSIFNNTDWNLLRLCPVPLWLAGGDEWPPDASILASVDPTHENDEYSELDIRILDMAESLGEKLGRELHAFHSFAPLNSSPMTLMEYPLVANDSVRKEILEDHQMRVDMLLKHYDIKADNVHVEAGDPALLLPEMAKVCGAGVVVMGSIARNPLQRIFIGSTTEKVVNKLPCDLLVVKPEWFVTPVVPSEPELVDSSSQD